MTAAIGYAALAWFCLGAFIVSQAFSSDNVSPKEREEFDGILSDLRESTGPVLFMVAMFGMFVALCLCAPAWMFGRSKP